MRPARQLLRNSTLHVLVAAAVAIALVPSTAAGHSAPLGMGDEPIDVNAAATHEARLASALASLPRETALGTCLATRHVDGLGDACRSDDGEFLVRLASGITVATHGTDAPRDPDSRAAAAPHLPDSQAAIDGASVADIECTTAAGDRRVELVYARPSDKPDRSASIAASMRMALYQASAFVDAEAQALDPAQGRRFRVLCSGGLPFIHNVTVDPSGTWGGNYGDIVDDLVEQGFPAPTSSTSSTRRFMIFYDSESADESAGVGGMWLDDDPGVDNYNNLGARYAVEFDWSESHLPHWDIFLHEMSHNMGAVADDAPNSSQYGHCIDGYDIMCYADGGTGGTYTTTSCPVSRYDCGGDTYFNPAPPGGSWLASHWNVASTNNLWLVPRDLGWDDGGVPDTTPPTVPTSPTVSVVTQTSLTLSWGASTDDRSAVRYRVEVDRNVGGSWELYATYVPLTPTTLAITSLPTYTSLRLRVASYDQAGNTSAAASTTATTLSGPPVAPASAALTIIDEASLAAAWVAGSSAAGVRGHDLEYQPGSGGWIRVGEVPGTTATLTGLASGADYRIRVRTVANDGGISGWRTSSFVTTPGELAGGGDALDALDAPTVSVVRSGPTRANASWTTSPGAERWTVTLTGGRGAARSLTTSTPRISLSGLAPNATYVLSVTALTGDGSQSSEAGIASFRTPRDVTAPGTSRFAKPRFVGTVMRISWVAARDDAGVARYQLQRRRGTRWIPVAVRSGATSANVAGVRRGSVAVLRVRAIDVGGNAGRWTTMTFRRR